MCKTSTSYAGLQASSTQNRPLNNLFLSNIGIYQPALSVECEANHRFVPGAGCCLRRKPSYGGNVRCAQPSKLLTGNGKRTARQGWLISRIRLTNETSNRV